MITDFLRHFGIASNVLQLADETGPSPTPAQLDHAAKYAAMWLTPLSVEGFDPTGFRDLTEADRDELEHAVEQFRLLGESVGREGSPTEDQVREGRRLASSIYRIVSRYLYDPETIEVVKAIHRLQRQDWFPDFVVGFDLELGLDSTDDPAAWVWFIVTDEAATDDLVGRLPTLRKGIRGAMRAKGIDRLVYVRFRTLSEQLELLAGVPE